jgi:aryl-alcohol dehydrogenase-like predicted oxidoreductase
MEYRPLGRTGITVSQLCLGGMMSGVFGNPDHDESVIALIRRDAAERHGPPLPAVLSAVSARLSTPALRDLHARAESRGRPAGSVADGWLRAQALTPAGRGPQ